MKEFNYKPYTDLKFELLLIRTTYYSIFCIIPFILGYLIEQFNLSEFFLINLFWGFKIVNLFFGLVGMLCFYLLSNEEKKISFKIWSL